MWSLLVTSALAADCPAAFRWSEPLAICVQGAEQDGVRDGSWTLGFPDGSPRVTGHFEAGRPVGVWEERDLDGTVLRVTRFGGADGGPDTEGWTHFSNGSVQEAIRPLDCDQGAVREVAENRNEVVEYCVAADLVLSGEYRDWDRTGTLYRLRPAPFLGELREWGRYDQGSKHGTWFRRPGNVVKAEGYDQGERLDGDARPPRPETPPPPLAPASLSGPQIPWGPRCRARDWRPVELAAGTLSRPSVARTDDGGLLLLDGSTRIARIDPCRARAAESGEAPRADLGASLSATAVATSRYGRFDQLRLGNDSWRLPEAGAPSVRRGPATAVLADQAVVWGGYAPPADYLSDGATYDFDTAIWTPLPTTGAPSARANAIAGGGPGRFVVWGGVVREGPTPLQPLSDGGLLDLDAGTWSTVPGDGPPHRQGAVLSVARAGALLYGGRGMDGSVLADAWLLSFDTMRWHDLDLEMAGLVVRPTADGRFLIKEGIRFSILAPETAERTPLPPVEGPFAAFGFDGHTVVVWGHTVTLHEGSECPEHQDPDEPICDPIGPVVRIDNAAWVLSLPR